MSAVSSSLMVTVAVAGVPRVAPCGFVSVTWKVSAPSKCVSLMSGTTNVLTASPGLNVSVSIVVA